jgi:hypothetical protein
MDYPDVHEERVGLESVAHDPFIDGLTRSSEMPAVAPITRPEEACAHAPSPERAFRRARRLTARLRGH